MRGLQMVKNRLIDKNGDGKEPKAAMPGEAAQRALKEAEIRRAAATKSLKKEIGGRDGPDPARYGDWEVKGIASDF